MRALDAPRARKLQPRGRADTLARTALARSAEPRHALPFSQLHAKPPLAAPGRPSTSRRRCPTALRRAAPPKPPRLATCPWNSACSSAAMSASARRRHDALLLQNVGSPESLSTAAAEPPCHAIKRDPKLPRARRQPQATPMTLPQLANRPRRASLLISGNSCRRHRPGQSGTSSTSPSPFSSPETSSSSREPFPLLDFDREPSPPQNHFATEASSAAKLAAGSSLRPHRPGNHREDRTRVAHPSPPSGPR